MKSRNELREELQAFIATLARRLDSTGDRRERVIISTAIRTLRREASRRAPADPNAILRSLAIAHDELQRLAAAAGVGPFDGYLCALECHLARLDRLSGRLHARRALPAAILRRARGRSKSLPARRTGRGLLAGRAVIIDSTRFEDLREEYARCFAKCRVRADYRGAVEYYVKRLRTGEPGYERVQSGTGVPWQFVGVIHAMECGFNFSGHLHNGDPLTARTVHVPQGRPLDGSPPFTWLQSAIDALRLRKLDEVSDWSVPHMLFLLEAYNGFGYRRHGVPTPYLWSFSNLYSQGKFTQDGQFSPAAVSRQCGAALMLKEIIDTK